MNQPDNQPVPTFIEVVVWTLKTPDGSDLRIPDADEVLRWQLARDYLVQAAKTAVSAKGEFTEQEIDELLTDAGDAAVKARVKKDLHERLKDKAIPHTIRLCPPTVEAYRRARMKVADNLSQRPPQRRRSIDFEIGMAIELLPDATGWDTVPAGEATMFIWSELHRVILPTMLQALNRLN